MKKMKKYVRGTCWGIFFGLILFSLLFSGNVQARAGKTTKKVKVRTIAWKNVKNTTAMYTGSSKRFTVKILPAKAKKMRLEWKSSNPAVATVSSNGTVKAKKPGSVIIRCRVKGQPKKVVRCRVKIIPILVNEVKYTNDSLVVLQLGQRVKRKATAFPSSAYNKRVRYISNNPSVATVDQAGNIKSCGIGSCTIGAFATDGSGKKAYLTVRVVGQITKDFTRFIAHRGLCTQAPENTLKAFKLAGKAGFWGAEADIRMTKDGHFIVLHDASFERTCGVKLNPEDLTLQEVKNLRVKLSSRYSSMQGDIDAITVPTLEEYLSVCKEYNMMPIIELKMMVEYEKENVQNVTREDLENLLKVTRKVMENREVTFICGPLSPLTELKSILKTVDYAVDAAEYAEQEQGSDGNAPMRVYFQYLLKNPTETDLRICEANSFGMDALYSNTTPSMIKKVQSKKIPLNLWVVDRADQVWDFVKQGVDFITTNFQFWEN